MYRPAVPSPGRFILTTLIILAVSTFWAGYIAARSSGHTGDCAASNGCSCHSSSPNANGDVTVTITGPQLVDAGSTNTYTIAVSGSPSGSTGGFNLCTSGGTLISGTGSKVDGGELTHSNGDNRSWTFEWIAPMSGTANYEFHAVAQATNGSGSSGDSWNWYGDTQGAPFSIVVMGPLPVEHLSWGLLKARY